MTDPSFLDLRTYNRVVPQRTLPVPGDADRSKLDQLPLERKYTPG